jgi:hypothetical protein
MPKTIEKRTPLYKDLRRIIKKWAKNQQTDFSCAFRDALTDMQHLANDEKLDFADRLGVATSLFHEEEEDN